MVNISDDFIQKYYDLFYSIDMHTQYLGNINAGLDYYGITIIDKTMATELKLKLELICEPCKDSKKLIKILNKCISKDCYVIHFGI